MSKLDDFTVALNVTELAERPFVLHEEIADGKFAGEPIKLIRTIDSAMMYMTYKGKYYRIKSADIVLAICQKLKAI